MAAGSKRHRIASLAVALAVAGLAGCGDNEADDGQLSAGDATSTTVSSTTTSSSTTAPAPGSSTSAPAGDSFGGSTTPTSVAASPDLGVALLSDVEVEGGDAVDRVMFVFEEGIPGYDAAYIEPPVRQDGSGEVVEVEGAAFFEIRFAPASGVDLRGSLEQVYTGPAEVRGDTAVLTEVVRTGDFEANLTWVVGVDRQVPYRIAVDQAAGTVSVDFSTS